MSFMSHESKTKYLSVYILSPMWELLNEEVHFTEAPLSFGVMMLSVFYFFASKPFAMFNLKHLSALIFRLFMVKGY